MNTPSQDLKKNQAPKITPEVFDPSFFDEMLLANVLGPLDAIQAHQDIQIAKIMAPITGQTDFRLPGPIPTWKVTFIIVLLILFVVFLINSLTGLDSSITGFDAEELLMIKSSQIHQQVLLTSDMLRYVDIG